MNGLYGIEEHIVDLGQRKAGCFDVGNGIAIQFRPKATGHRAHEFHHETEWKNLTASDLCRNRYYVMQEIICETGPENYYLTSDFHL